MTTHRSGSGGAGLERSCDENASDWVRQTDVVGGVELFEARLQHLNYRRHRHDTYAISLTESGVLTFGFRGATHVSLPGQVVVLHPDELHDGRAGADAGFGYRQLYVEPASLFPAIQAFGGASALPFVRQPVITSPILAAVIRAAFDHDREPLAIDDVLTRVAAGLLTADPDSLGTCSKRRIDVVALDRARQFLDAETARVVHSRELEAITGLDRFELSRQFRTVLGTSPYRYSLMRRLGAARAAIAQHQPLVDVALATGFADQAHFTRRFTAAFGITPGQYSALTTPEHPRGRTSRRRENPFAQGSETLPRCHPEPKVKDLGCQGLWCVKPRCPRFARQDTVAESVASATLAAKGTSPALFDGAFRQWQTGVFSARRRRRNVEGRHMGCR